MNFGKFILITAILLNITACGRKGQLYLEDKTLEETQKDQLED